MVKSQCGLSGCRELNIATAAIYAECEATAIYVKKANEAYLVGPGPVQGFLDTGQIVSLAKRIGADAIHPGYGFLAENAQFAHLCREADITFIGPTPEAMELLGNKVHARELAKQIGIPVVPGTEDRVQSVEEGLNVARSIGYPVMVKASAGGGGRGLRVVRSDEELKEAMESGAREALAAFGNADLFLEKYIERPHHIEFQLLADKEGHVVHLGERDCSIQRRHQKMIEIAPSLILTPQLRVQMGEAAIELARAANSNADRRIPVDQEATTFMEMTPRIQVRIRSRSRIPDDMCRPKFGLPQDDRSYSDNMK